MRGLPIALVLIVFVLVACGDDDGPPKPLTEESGQQAKQIDVFVQEAEERLLAGETAFGGEFLIDERCASIQHLRRFRGIVKRNAPTGEVVMVRPDEKGQKLRILGVLKSEEGGPIADALIYAFQTDHRGYYHPSDSAADHSPRLFAFVRTDDDGRFQIDTVMPGAYAHAPTTPKHVHIRVHSKQFTRRRTGGDPSVFFADDPNLDAETRREVILEEGTIAEPETGEGGMRIARWAMTLIPRTN